MEIRERLARGVRDLEREYWRRFHALVCGSMMVLHYRDRAKFTRARGDTNVVNQAGKALVEAAIAIANREFEIAGTDTAAPGPRVAPERPAVLEKGDRAGAVVGHRDVRPCARRKRRWFSGPPRVGVLAESQLYAHAPLTEFVWCFKDPLVVRVCDVFFVQQECLAVAFGVFARRDPHLEGERIRGRQLGRIGYDNRMMHVFDRPSGERLNTASETAVRAS